MKAVIILLLVALLGVVYGYESSGLANRGYPAQRTGSVGGWFYVSWTIKASDVSVANGTYTKLKIKVDPQGSATTSKANYYFAFGANPTVNSTLLRNKERMDVSALSMPVTIFGVEANGTTWGNLGGTFYFGAFLAECITCSSSGDFFVEVELYHSSSTTTEYGTVQPFDAIHNPFTNDYSASVNTFAAPAARYIATQTTNIYVQVDMATSATATQKIAITFSNTTAFPTSDDYTNGMLRYPAYPSVPGNGRFVSTAIPLAPGTWYIVPYCAGAISTCVFDVAIGIGSEPAGAAAIAPSLVFAAVLSAIVTAFNW